MMDYNVLISLAVILLFTKLFGIMSERVHLPQVVGAILAGVLLGPSVLGLLERNEFLTVASEIGVIMLMFLAGLDTDIGELKKTGFAAFIIACLGVAVPIIGCGAVYAIFFIDKWSYISVLKALFVGVVFAATSVSITVEALNEMGKLKSRVGATLLSAALIDDIIGIVVLSVITGLADSASGKSGGENPLIVLIKILCFFLFIGVVGFIIYKLFKKLSVDYEGHRRIAIWALAFCFFMSFCAEKLFGVADITGAFFAGVILCNIAKLRKYVAKKINVASYMLFTPIFFTSIGLRTDLHSLNGSIIVFALLLLFMAVATKIVGCGVGARICGIPKRDSLSIGIGMVARGEVALMVTQKGIDSGYIDNEVFPAVVLVVIVAALLTPVLLKLSFKKEGNPQKLQSQE